MSAELTRTIETIRDKRLHAARAAAQLSIIGRENGVSVEGIPWDVLPAIPDWCLLDAKERHTLQRVCGALYLAPLIKNSIDGGVLRKLNIFVGDAIFQHVRTTDDLTHSIEPRGFENHVEVQVMAAGSSVLLHTLQVTSLMELYKEIIGPPDVTLDIELASRVYDMAYSLLYADDATIHMSKSVA